MDNKPCKHCGKAFNTRKADYCPECAIVSLECPVCETQFPRRHSSIDPELIAEGNNYYTCSVRCREIRKAKNSHALVTVSRTNDPPRKPFWITEAGEDEFENVMFQELIPVSDQVREEVKNRCRDPKFLELLGWTAGI